MKKTKISTDDFVRKILAGEKNFDNIELDFCNLYEHGSFQAVNEVLLQRHGYHNYVPLSLGNASLFRFYAPRIHLAGANLSAACLADASLWDANLSGAKLTKANLEKANCKSVNFYEAVLVGANVSWTDFYNANFTQADLRDVYGLESAGGLFSVNLYRTKVSAIPAAVLTEKAVKDRIYLLDSSQK